jgi:hypothetical protein
MLTDFNLTSAATSEGFLDKGGIFTFLQFLGSSFTQALGLNNDGEVVGLLLDGAGNTHGLSTISLATPTPRSMIPMPSALAGS